MDGERHEISVVVKGDAIEPLADVAPEGPVTLVVVNESNETQDLTLVRLDDREQSNGLPTTAQVSDLRGIEAGGARTAEYQLTRGRYLLLLDPGQPSDGEAVLDLTVQPVEGAE